MKLSDISIKRPVFATVLSLLLMAFGILSFRELPLREYPDIDSPIVSISTSYPGASADIVESKITRIIEDEIAGIEGIRALSSTSNDGRSNINIEFLVDRDIDIAANDVRDRVSRVVRRLPDEADPPVVSKTEVDSYPIIWFNLISDGGMNRMDLTDYAERYLVDQFSSVDGVAQIRLGGEHERAMRIWIDRDKLAARGLTVNDIEEALRRENVELPAGKLESATRELNVRVARSYLTPEHFAALVLKRGDDGYLVRLGEVAKVEIGPWEHRREFRTNGDPMIGIGIIKQSKANTLEMVRRVHEKADQIRRSLPAGVQLMDSSDDSVFIEESIREVYRTLAIAMVLVIAVIYLFLGSVRAMLVPAATVPVSLIASFIALAAFGYSVNLVTLLALVLAIGLVVDDSIVVLENIYRRMEAGEPPLVAAYRGTRQVAMPVFATTMVLVAVFAPVAFLSGNLGRVFTELSVAMSGAVLISMVVALSLSPMMCSKLLRPTARTTLLTRTVDSIFERASLAYGETLQKLFRWPLLTIAIMLGVLGTIYAMLQFVPQEFAPDEDRGKFFVNITAPEGASFEYSLEQTLRLEQIALRYVENGEAESVLARVPGWGGGDAVNSGLLIVTMKDWAERPRSTQEVINEFYGRAQAVPGVTAFSAQSGGLRSVGGGRGRPVQFVIGGDSFEELAEWRDVMLAQAASYPGLNSVEADLRETKPQLLVTIDRNRAADLGVSVRDIGTTLETMFNGRRVTTFIERGEEYDVMLQGRDDNRRSPQDLNNIYVRAKPSGTLVPLSSLVRFEEGGTATALHRYNRMRAVTITANISPGYTLGEVLTFLEQAANDHLPERAQIDYKGESREFKDASNALYFVFGLALLVVYLVLAAQFESFIHPMVIMMTVPLALAGALVGLFLSDGTLNVYSQIGIIMLIGIAAKNGILIVEFANQLRDAGRSFDDAIVEASRIRLRPILMTSISTLFGALPLILASGAGAESRVTIGLVIFFGVGFATLFTLYVVPVFYRLLARHTKSPGHVAAQLERMLERAPAE